MNEQFFHDRAKTVRDLAERADPHTEAAAARPRQPLRQEAAPADAASGKAKPLSNAVGLVEEILSIPSGSVVVDRDDNRAGEPTAPSLTSRILSDVIERREEG